MESVWDSFHFIAHKYLLSKIMRVQLYTQTQAQQGHPCFHSLRKFRNDLAGVKKTWSRLLPLPVLDLEFQRLWPLFPGERVVPPWVRERGGRFRSAWGPSTAN